MSIKFNMVKHSGNEELYSAMEMAIISLQLGQALNIHAYGLRGTGKTSVLRSIKNIVPFIRRIKDCPFNCDPTNPICPAHRDLSAQELETIETELVPMPMLEISHSAKIGTVVGSIDLKLLTSQKDPSVALMPGTIARANRGIIFIDEINRLADTSPELTDVLLDVMGTKPGTLQVEEEGLPKVVLPITVSVWAASNPDEDPGPLKSIRKQLSDRFDFNIHVRRPEKIDDLLSIIMEENSHKNLYERKDYAQELKKYYQVIFDSILLRKMASIFLRYDLESIRSLKSWYLSCRIHCLHRGSMRVEICDLISTFYMCFRHRLESDLIERIVCDLRGSNTNSHSNPISNEKDNYNQKKEIDEELFSDDSNKKKSSWSSWLGSLFTKDNGPYTDSPSNDEESEDNSDQIAFDEARQLRSIPQGQRIKNGTERK